MIGLLDARGAPGPWPPDLATRTDAELETGRSTMIPNADELSGEQLEAQYGQLLRAALAGPADPDAPLGVVVVSYGSHRLLADNLPPSLAERAGARIVVVDNLSTAAERVELRRLATQRSWILVEPSANEGFGAGVNRGVLRAAEAGCRSFLALNPDAVISEDVLRELARCVAVRPRALFSPRVVSSAGRVAFRGSLVDMRSGRMRSGWIVGDDDPSWKNWLTGACLAFSGEAFAELEGFADGYFLYWEDVDLSRRAAAAGLDLVFREDVSVIHDEGGTHNAPGESRAKSSTYYYYNTRNRLLFGARHAVGPDRRTWLLRTPAESFRIWLRGGRRQLLNRPGGLIAALRGTLSGLRLYRSEVTRRREQPEVRI